jgi:AraC family transcriptional regulator of adaptative response / DNA-3-methyladenine glycosylase II
LVSVRAATILGGRVAAEFGEPIETPDPELNRLAPEPERIAASQSRRATRRSAQ